MSSTSVWMLSKLSTLCGFSKINHATLCTLLLVGLIPAFGQNGGDDRRRPRRPGQDDKSYSIKQRSDLVDLIVTVTDKNGYAVNQIDSNDMEVYEDDVRQQIEYYSQEDTPVSIGIIFDVSASMRKKLVDARRALDSFIATSHPEDDFFLISFNRRIKLMEDFGCGEDLSKTLSKHEAAGETAFYDAVHLGIETAMRGRHHKRALLVFSDGQDNSSRFTFDKLRKLLKETDIQLYCIGINRGNLHWKEMQGRMILDELSSLTGGKAFFIKTASEMEDAAIKVAIELRRQYSIAYTPSDRLRDGSWRQIKVRIGAGAKKQKLNIRSRSGYYADRH